MSLCHRSREELFQAQIRQKCRWYLKLQYSEGRGCRKRRVEGQDWGLGHRQLLSGWEGEEKENKRGDRRSSWWGEENRGVPCGSQMKKDNLICAPGRAREDKNHEWTWVWQQGASGAFDEPFWWSDEGKSLMGVGFKWKGREALIGRDNVSGEVCCKVMQRNGGIAVEGSWVKRRHFSKIGELPAYLFVDGNDCVKSKKEKQPHSQNDYPHFAGTPVNQRMHGTHT